MWKVLSVILKSNKKVNMKKNINYKENLKKISEQMKLDAESFLNENNIMEILKTVSKNVEIIGSLKFDLMYASSDIDIKVLSKNIPKDAKKVFDLFSEKRLFQKMELGDFIKFKKKNRPDGFIVNLRSEYKNKKWEVEIWFIDGDEMDKELKYISKIERSLTEDKKILILEEKSKRLELGTNKEDVSSYEIYQKILNIK